LDKDVNFLQTFIVNSKKTIRNHCGGNNERLYNERFFMLGRRLVDYGSVGIGIIIF
jgi:hypothetical protein